MEPVPMVEVEIQLRAEIQVEPRAAATLPAGAVEAAEREETEMTAYLQVRQEAVLGDQDLGLLWLLEFHMVEVAAVAQELFQLVGREEVVEEVEEEPVLDSKMQAHRLTEVTPLRMERVAEVVETTDSTIHRVTMVVTAQLALSSLPTPMTRNFKSILKNNARNQAIGIGLYVIC
jgi:hypothetical protein